MRSAGEEGLNAPRRPRRPAGFDAAPLIGDGWERGDEYLALGLLRLSAEGAALPVFVSIHGGGFVVGAKNASVRDGRTTDRLASSKRRG